MPAAARPLTVTVTQEVHSGCCHPGEVVGRRLDCAILQPVAALTKWHFRDEAAPSAHKQQSARQRRSVSEQACNATRP
jgi:hypothetical protein